MKKELRWNVLSLILLFLFAFVFANFTDSYAGTKRQDPTKSGIKEKAKAAKEKQTARWENLSPEQREYLKEEAGVRAKKTKMTAEEYWNSLSPEEQQEAAERSKEGLRKGRKRWQKLPE